VDICSYQNNSEYCSIHRAASRASKRSNRAARCSVDSASRRSVACKQLPARLGVFAGGGSELFQTFAPEPSCNSAIRLK
jgi:hypothetical protein